LQRLMRALLIVPAHPCMNSLPGFLEAAKSRLPDALLFETPKEPFNEPILLRRVRGNKLLRQTIISTGLAKAAALKNQPVVTPKNRRSTTGTQGAEAGEAGRLDGSFRFLGPSTQGKLIAHNLAIMTINHGGQMYPAILSAGNMGHIQGPATITLGRLTPTALHSRP
jgi:hypothetical protein